jgi:crotonobetainyl-CoA hydratase/dehydration protein DpgD
MVSGEHVVCERDGRIVRVTLNRPEVLNAMNLAMHEELSRIWDEVEADDDVWLVVLTGAGDRAFSVGQDLKELAAGLRAGTAPETSFGSRGRPGWPRLTERFGFSKPLMAVVRGYAYGGGFELAMACDLVIASADATFALPEARLGLIAGAGGVFRLTRQAPYRAALGHLMTGRSMTAQRAYDLGLINEVVSGDELGACAERWERDLLRCAPLAVRAVKQAAASTHLSLEEAFTADYSAERRRMASEDAKEGPVAFAEKRESRWQGR